MSAGTRDDPSTQQTTIVSAKASEHSKAVAAGRDAYSVDFGGDVTFIALHQSAAPVLCPRQEGQLPGLPQPFFERDQLQAKIERTFRLSFWERLVAAVRRTRPAGRRLCVVVGKSGVGKSAMALKVATDYKSRYSSRQTFHYFWPQRHSGTLGPNDLVVVDNVYVTDNTGDEQLDWLCRLRGMVLITTQDKSTARRILARCGVADRAERVVIGIPKLSEKEALQFLQAHVTSDRFAAQLSELKAAATCIDGSPFYLQILAEIANARVLPSITDTEPAAFRRALARAWVRRMRKNDPSQYKTLSKLSLIAQFGTSPLYVSRMTGLDHVQVRETLLAAVNRGFAYQPLEGDDYVVPHELVREAFREELSSAEIAQGRRQFIRFAKSAIDNPPGQPISFAGTLDAVMLATIEAFDARSHGDLVEAATLFRDLAKCKFSICPPHSLMRWLEPWVADRIFDACASVIAVARTVQSVEPRSEMLGSVMLRAITHEDSYAAIEAILAVSVHWQESPEASRQELAGSLISSGESLLKTSPTVNGWDVGLKLYSLLCTIDILSEKKMTAMAIRRWKQSASVQAADGTAIGQLLDVAQGLRASANGSHGAAAASLLRVQSLRNSSLAAILLFVDLERSRTPRSDHGATTIELNFDLFMVFARLAHHSRLVSFAWFLWENHARSSAPDAQNELVLGQARFIDMHRRWSCDRAAQSERTESR